MKIDIKKIFSKKTIIKNPVEGARDPHVAWVTIYATGIILFVLFAVFHYLLFRSLGKDSEAIDIVSQNSNLRVIREDKLSEVAQYFETKEKTRVDLLVKPISIEDPSL